MRFRNEFRKHGFQQYICSVLVSPPYLGLIIESGVSCVFFLVYPRLYTTEIPHPVENACSGCAVSTSTRPQVIGPGLHTRTVGMKSIGDTTAVLEDMHHPFHHLRRSMANISELDTCKRRASYPLLIVHTRYTTHHVRFVRNRCMIPGYAFSPDFSLVLLSPSSCFALDVFED